MWITDYRDESGVSGPTFAQLFYIELLSIHLDRPNFMFHWTRVKVTDTQCSDCTTLSHHPRATFNFSRRDLLGQPQAESLQQPEGNESTLQNPSKQKMRRGSPQLTCLHWLTSWLLLHPSVTGRGRKHAAKSTAVYSRCSPRLYS